VDLLRTLRIFIRVAEVGSFSVVAREAGSTQSAVSRQITMLEDHFRIRLFHRTTRRLSLTDDGRILVNHAEQLLQEAASMEDVFRNHRENPVGLVRMAAPTGVAQFLAPRLGELSAQHTGLSVELLVRDTPGDLIQAGLDLAIIRGEMRDSSLVVRQVGHSRKVVVAAPSYLSEHGTPNTPDDLASHKCIVLTDEHDQRFWNFSGPTGQIRMRIDGPIATDNQQVAMLIALGGHGIALLTETRVFDDVQAGRLVPLLPLFPSQPVPIQIVYPTRRNIASRTRLVLDFLVEEMRAGLASAQRLGAAGWGAAEPLRDAAATQPARAAQSR
jgi:DNA-binding transcriptional LysR family regulator